MTRDELLAVLTEARGMTCTDPTIQRMIDALPAFDRLVARRERALREIKSRLSPACSDVCRHPDCLNWRTARDALAADA